MKIIFLDIDGVLNSWQSYFWYVSLQEPKSNTWISYPQNLDLKKKYNHYERELCPLACNNLKLLLDRHTDARVVISSTWRMNHDVAWFNDIFKEFGIIKEDRVIDVTPRLNTIRGKEIQHWLEHNSNYEISHFIILDDDKDMGIYKDTDNFVHINGKVGFDYVMMEKVDKFFSNFNLTYKDLKENIAYKMFSKPREENYYKDSEGMFYFLDSGEKRHVFFYKDKESFAEVQE